jgi:hypothetical protein
MPVARSADSQKYRRRLRALETGPDASARKQRERELAQERKQCHQSHLAISNPLCIPLLSLRQIIEVKEIAFDNVAHVFLLFRLRIFCIEKP